MHAKHGERCAICGNYKRFQNESKNVAIRKTPPAHPLWPPKGQMHYGPQTMMYVHLVAIIQVIDWAEVAKVRRLNVSAIVTCLVRKDKFRVFKRFLVPGGLSTKRVGGNYSIWTNT